MERCCCSRSFAVESAIDANRTSSSSSPAYGKAVAAAFRGKAAAAGIASENPEAPVTAISNAAWGGDERLLLADALSTFAPNVVQRIGCVITCLTFGNVNAVSTGDGLVLIDCGTVRSGQHAHRLIRTLAPEAPVHTAIYTHGHNDHISLQHMGFQEEQPARPIRVVAHENIVARFDRYLRFAGYNTKINQRQFQLPRNFRWNEDYRYPDLTYKTQLNLKIGGETFELHHVKGETDDATVVWLPKHRFAFVGDLFIWNAPNAGNPQKSQRFPEEWAQALLMVADWRPNVVFPGHGPPILGEERCRIALQDTAALINAIASQAVALINEGVGLRELMAQVVVPADLVIKPYLRPNYDDPRFIAAMMWRRFAGWWGQDVTLLLPVPKAATGALLARIAPVDEIAARALAVVSEHAGAATNNGHSRESVGAALEIIDFLASSHPENRRVAEARAKILRTMEDRETALMARSIYRAAAIDSEARMNAKL